MYIYTYIYTVCPFVSIHGFRDTQKTMLSSRSALEQRSATFRGYEGLAIWFMARGSSWSSIWFINIWDDME